MKMADVTFGVKVSEEMKTELSELMKTTELSGKEFMGMLLASYRLESNKKDKSFYSDDINELQRLLNRIQGLYLNMGQKIEFLIEEKVQESEVEVHKKEEEVKGLLDQIEGLEKKLVEKEKEMNDKNTIIQELEDKQKETDKELEQSKNQLINNQLLYNKYETEIQSLVDKIEGFSRLEIEIEERNAENQKLKTRNDELASDIWFLQREIEKLKDEREKEIEKLQEDQIKLKQTYDLELKNQLLEQKLANNAKIELLKEENFKTQQEYAKKMQEYLEGSLKAGKKEK